MNIAATATLAPALEDEQNPDRGLWVSAHQSSSHRTDFSMAADAYWEGDHGAARKILNPLLRENPDNDSAISLLAKVSENNDPSGSLRSNAQKLVQTFENKKNFTGVQDRTLLNNAFKLVHIAQAFDRAQKTDAHHYHLALIAHAEGDDIKAQQHLDITFDIHPKHGKAKKLRKLIEAQKPDVENGSTIEVSEQTETMKIAELERILDEHAVATDKAETIEPSQSCRPRFNKLSPTGSSPAQLVEALNAMSLNEAPHKHDNNNNQEPVRYGMDI